MKDITKRLIDISFAMIFFVVFGWLYLAVWLGVAITCGRPAIYRHRRIGKNGIPFDCLKFRSMVKNSDSVLIEYLAENPEAREEWEREFKLKNDPRITKLGKLLRKTSLDELPQFWNVLKGEMSLVGPRPVVLRELEVFYKERRRFYESVKPGITGPWQVGGRSDLNYEDRIALDVNYALNWSLITDALIVFKTVKAVVAQRGSY